MEYKEHDNFYNYYKRQVLVGLVVRDVNRTMLVRNTQQMLSKAARYYLIQHEWFYARWTCLRFAKAIVQRNETLLLHMLPENVALDEEWNLTDLIRCMFRGRHIKYNIQLLQCESFGLRQE